MTFGDQVKVIGWYDNEWGYSNRLADLTALVGRPALMKRIDDLDVAGQVVLLRADLNVPLDGDVITDDGRIRASLPTIRTLTGRGRPGGHLRSPGPAQGGRVRGAGRGRPVAAAGRRPARRAARPARAAGRGRGRGVGGRPGGRAGRRRRRACWRTSGSSPAETSKDDAERAGLAARLAALATCYVGDGFGALHRKHASVYDVPALLPHAAGELVIAEIAVLRQLTSDPPRPYVVVLGGAKPSDKLAVIGNLLSRADRLIICGGMSYTFLAAQGYEVGKSLLEADQIPQVTEVLAEAARRGVEVVLPVDLVAADRFAPDADHRVVPVSDFPADRESLDMGPADPGPVRARSWPTRRPCSGTARPACSSSRRSPPAPGRSPRRSAGSAG